LRKSQTAKALESFPAPDRDARARRDGLELGRVSALLRKPMLVTKGIRSRAYILALTQ
jgi:hypothetical protein